MQVNKSGAYDHARSINDRLAVAGDIRCNFYNLIGADGNVHDLSGTAAPIVNGTIFDEGIIRRGSTSGEAEQEDYSKKDIPDHEGWVLVFWLAGFFVLNIEFQLLKLTGIAQKNHNFRYCLKNRTT